MGPAVRSSSTKSTTNNVVSARERNRGDFPLVWSTENLQTYHVRRGRVGGRANLCGEPINEISGVGILTTGDGGDVIVDGKDMV